MTLKFRLTTLRTGDIAVELVDAAGKVHWSQIAGAVRRQAHNPMRVDLRQITRLKRKALAWCQDNGIEIE